MKRRLNKRWEKTVWGILLPMVAFGIYEEIRMLVRYTMASNEMKSAIAFEIYNVSYSLSVTIIIIVTVFVISSLIRQKQRKHK